MPARAILFSVVLEFLKEVVSFQICMGFPFNYIANSKVKKQSPSPGVKKNPHKTPIIVLNKIIPGSVTHPSVILTSLNTWDQ